jgi:hypothetical protein
MDSKRGGCGGDRLALGRRRRYMSGEFPTSRPVALSARRADSLDLREVL